MSYAGSGSGGTGAIHSLTDTALNNPVDAQVLSYNGTTQKWTNATVSTGSGAVSSVAGKTGAVTLAEGDVANLTTDLATITTAVAGKAKAGANTDITSLGGLTTALPIVQGGTGATTASGVRLNIGLGNVQNQGIIVLGPSDPVPGGTPTGTIIIRTS